MTENQFTGKLVGEGFPHPYLEEALEFQLSSVEIVSEDSVGDDAVHIVQSDRRVSLIGVPTWEKVTISGTIEVPEKVFNATLPYDEREQNDPSIELVLAIRSPQTILRIGRFGEQLNVDVTSPDEYPVFFELERSQIRGDVTVQPYLVRTRGQDDDLDYAQNKGDRLASSNEWTVRVDEVEDDGGFLHPRIEPFDRHPSFPGEKHLHYLHFDDPSTPKLYLNANHGRLIDVLQNEGTTGADPRFRDVLYDYIEQSVWQDLLLRTANDVNSETGEARFPWQEEVIEIFEDTLYSDEDGNEAVARRMAEDATSGEDLDVLVHEIDRAIQERIGHPQSAVALFQEGLHND